MSGCSHPFEERNGAAVQPGRVGKFAATVEYGRERRHVMCELGMAGAKRLLPDLQRMTSERFRAEEVARGVLEAGKIVIDRGHLLVARPVRLFRDHQ
jgi:hypothetical protein